MKKALKEGRRHINLGYRWGQVFLSRNDPRPMRSVWSLGELYGRSTRWATIFKHRMAGRRVDESMAKLRNELLDCISLNSAPILTHMLRD